MNKLYSALVMISCLLLSTGCQSFQYYDSEKPHRGKKSFLNNYDNSPKANVWKWYWERLTKSKPQEPPFDPEILKVDLEYLRSNRTQTSYTWIGHASALLQIEGVNILIDPVFSERVSPVSFLGPKRLVKLPVKIEELPSIDIVLVSHSHYDHLDLASLKELYKRDPEKTKFLVPLGNKALLESEGIQNVAEFDWWDKSGINGLKLVFTPAQHWSARSLWDHDQTLWGGWFVASEKFKFLYTGDTGYSKDFQDIHERLGGMDLAMIPVGAYEPRWFMKKQHVNPEEAIRIHQDLKAKTSIGVHWGTFRLSDEPMVAPLQEISKARKKLNLSEQDFQMLKHGQTIKF